MKNNLSISEACAEIIAQFATQGDSVAIPGFGSFSGTKHPETIITQPDGSRLLLPPSIEASFKPSVLLRKRLEK